MEEDGNGEPRYSKGEDYEAALQSLALFGGEWNEFLDILREHTHHHRQMHCIERKITQDILSSIENHSMGDNLPPPDEVCKAFLAACYSKTPAGNAKLLVRACQYFLTYDVIAPLVDGTATLTTTELLVNEVGKSPLHYYLEGNDAACDPQVVQKLVKVHPFMASTKATHGPHPYPLYLACDVNAPFEVIQALLDVFPEAVAKPKSSDDELYFALIKLPMEVLFSGNHGYSYTLTNGKWTETYNADFVSKMRLLLWAACTGASREPSSEESWSVVDAAMSQLGAACTWSMVEFFFQIYFQAELVKGNFVLSKDPERTRDSQGRLPIHVVSSHPTHLGVISAYDAGKDQWVKQSAVDVFLSRFPNAVREKDSQGRTPLHLKAGAKPDLADGEHDIHALLDACTSSAKEKDNHGMLPIHHAVAVGREWSKGVKELFLAFPQSASMLDPTTGLFPFMASAMAQDETVDTSFELLRADPTLVYVVRKNNQAIERKAYSRDQVMCHVLS